jgi:pyridoxal phosphate enzyme (YggS family)
MIMSIAAKITELGEQMPAGVTLVAVGKTHPTEALMEAYGAGQRVFGENRPQEMTAKFDAMPSDVRWHMIGHLQTNKVRMIAPFVELIHSVDSDRLLETISREAGRVGRVQDVLMEVHIAREESKWGWTPDGLAEFLGAGFAVPNVRLRGLMGIASLTDDTEQIRREMLGLRVLFERLQRGMGHGFDTLSMGMSGDWRIALECGSNMIRVGSTIFGERDYK